MGLFNKKPERISKFNETAGARGFGAPLHLQFSKRDLPGSGARQYSYDTLALPRYTPIGWGVQNQRSFDPYGAPILYWNQTIGIESLVYNGNYSGQVTTTPLYNADNNAGNADILPAFQGAELPTGY